MKAKRHTCSLSGGNDNPQDIRRNILPPFGEKKCLWSASLHFAVLYSLIPLYLIMS